MVSVSEAASIILSHPFIPRKEKVSIMLSVGRVLAESIHADRDFPPFNRVTMDGIALLSKKFQDGVRSFEIKGILAAGKPRTALADPSGCIEVMTGAVLPEGTDTVVRYEDIEISNGRASIKIGQISRGDNVHIQGADAGKNKTLLTPGIRISPAEVALIASVGKSAVEVFAFPKTAIISTGDELVSIDQIPLPHQIRQSNAYALQAALLELRCEANLFSVTDQKESLEKNLSAIFQHHELIILSGGVSKGKFDYIPQVLESLGVKKLFHQVTQKPGKPFWFGASDHQTVFALPGNPVSTYLCFYRFVKPWLMKSFGSDEPFPSAVLAHDFSFKPSLTYFLQVKIQEENGQRMAYPDPGGGSGDFANLKDVDGFLELPAEKTDFKKGEVFSFVPFR
jgi:molybdopterin molybdotransferase